MNIKNIGFIGSILEITKKYKADPYYKKKVDEVRISPVALKKLNILTDKKINKIIKNTANIRQNKVEEIKTKMKTDSYIKNINYEKLAENILNSPFSFSSKDADTTKK